MITMPASCTKDGWLENYKTIRLETTQIKKKEN